MEGVSRQFGGFDAPAAWAGQTIIGEAIADLEASW